MYKILLYIFIISLMALFSFVFDETGNYAKLTIILGIVSLILLIISDYKEKNKKTKQDIKYNNIDEELEKIDQLNGQQFENYIINLLSKIGYTNIKGTAFTGDYGVDIVVEKNGLKCAIQCKRYNNKVPTKAIQEIKSGKTYYKCDKAIVITNNYYTRNAQNLANSVGVQLIDRDDIIHILKSFIN